MADVLIHRAIAALGTLRVENIPEQAEPLVQERGFGSRHGQFGSGKIIRELRVNVILGVGIHRIVTQAIPKQIAIFIPPSVRTILSDVYLMVSVDERSRTVKHLMAEKVFVNVSVEQCSLALGGNGHLSGASDLRCDCAIIHHGYGSTDRAAHGVHVGHVGVNVDVHGDEGGPGCRQLSARLEEKKSMR